MASDAIKYDGALLAILQNEGKVAPFLDVVLGFLYRRTDFFRVMKKDTDKLGFPPGVAFKLLENIFKKYESLSKQDYLKAEKLKESREKENEGKHELMETEEEKSNKNNTDLLTTENEGNCTTDSNQTAEQASLPVSHHEPMERGPKDTEEESPSHSVKQRDTASGAKPKEDDEDNEDPEQARQRRALQANPLTYNGAERDSYFWSQSITEADVRVKVQKSIVKGKQVKVDIKKKHITVKKQEDDGSWTDLVNNELTWEINSEESVWTLSPGEFVHINLEKKQERWWENVFVDEPKINTRKIDCSRPMTDLDDEAQAKIEEMMYNQRQKQLGLPQSHESKTQEMLRKAWDAEGSPFKGQPFDPGQFSVDPSGVVNFKD
ncbi:unnamed protein product [Lymnaea stagnalis]|uniref:CS domain-containing protein n=1 Tax=Lymnaea stagnalis TaxID=6523 RepID=A0AAV2I7Q3_LYMST